MALCLGYLTVPSSVLFNNLLFFETDLSEYCIAIKEMRMDWWAGDMPPKRSRLAASLASFLSFQFPLLDALSLSSILFTVMTFVFVYGWTSCLINPTVGLSSVLFMSLMVPIVMMPRFLTFYHHHCRRYSWLALSIWGRFRNWWAALLCGLGIGLCLLFDVRGLLWAAPYWIGAICLLFAIKKIWYQVVCFITLHIPIWISWFGGWWSYSYNSSSLEKQLDVRPLYVGFDENNPLYQPPWNVDSNFIWGWTSPTKFMETIDFIWTQKQYPVPPDFLAWQQSTSDTTEYLSHWNIVLTIAIPLGIWSLWKSKWEQPIVEKILLFICSVFPFLILYVSLTDLVEQHIRFYMHVFPGIAVVMGVASGAFISTIKEYNFLQSKWYCGVWYVLMFAMLYFGIRWSKSPVSPESNGK